MNSKFYISLEAARLLKEKGYDIPCIAYYQNDEFRPYAFSRYKLSISDTNAAPSYMNQYSAPTKSEAIDWLESKGIVVWVEPTIDGWLYFMKSEQHYEDNAEPIFGKFQTRLAAEEAAIIKALELL